MVDRVATNIAEQGADSSFPPPSRSCLRRQQGDLTSFDIGPSGITSAHIQFLALWGMISVVIFPLAFAGVYLGIDANDWELPIRAAVLVFGALGLVVALGPIFWTCANAWLRRERVQISPTGLLIRVGYPGRATLVQTADLSPVRIDTEKSVEAKHKKYFVRTPRVRIKWEGACQYVGTSLSPASVELLTDQLRETQREATRIGAGDDLLEWQFPPGAGLRAGARRLLRLITAPFRRPVSFIFCDALAISSPLIVLGGFEQLNLLEHYPIILAVFLIGLGLRHFDSNYLAGLAAYNRRFHWFPLLYVGIGLAIGLAGALATFRLFPPLVALVVMVGTSLTIHVSLLRRSARVKPVEGERSRPLLPVLLSLTLVPMAIVHEQALFIFFEDTARRYFVMALPMVVPVVACVYLPVRLHFFIDSPDDRSNAIWFALTVTALLIYAVFGFNPFGH